MKLLRPAHGAEIRRIDAARRYAGIHQLVVIRLGQVDVGSALLSEMLRHLGANFIAAFADAGADGGMQIGRFGSEAFAHGGDGMLGDFRDGSPPAGVNGRHSAMTLVDQ